METIKAYTVSLSAPKDLSEGYFKLGKIALEEIFKRVKFLKYRWSESEVIVNLLSRL